MLIIIRKRNQISALFEHVAQETVTLHVINGLFRLVIIQLLDLSDTFTLVLKILCDLAQTHFIFELIRCLTSLYYILYMYLFMVLK